MSYQVLARKWRPQAFDDVLGQEHVTGSLKNMLETGRIHHGYLFSGIRGIGKTTTARILAKALNCVQGPTPTPCNRCEFCKEITEGYAMDVEEIDGASNRGVDEVRILQDNVSYVPSRSRYKVFIIDEVHMLTAPAFNALLKTLEEPPPNVVFIMATTEPWKMPMTILSRCQQFKFKQSSSVELIELLKKLARHEGIAINDSSLALIAKTAGGSVRDAENLFDQVLSFSGTTIRDDDVRYVLGIPDQPLLSAFLDALFAHQTGQMFALMEQLVGQGYNLRLFCMELMERIRNLVMLKIAPQSDPYLVLFDYSRTELERYARRTTLSELQQMYWLLNEAEREIKFSPMPRFVLEMFLVKMTKVQALEPLDKLSRQLHAIKTTIAAVHPGESRPPTSPAIQQQQIVQETPAHYHSPDVLRVWEAVMERVKQKRPGLGAILRHALPVALTADTLTIGFHEDAQASKAMLETQKNMGALHEILNEYFGRSVRVATTIHNGAVSTETIRNALDQKLASVSVPPIMPQQSAATPLAEHSGAVKSNWKKRSAQKSPQYKPPVQVTVQEIVKMFDGEIEA